MERNIVKEVLDLVRQIPAGKAVSYGQVADWFGVNPRKIGSIMGSEGGVVCWWRVLYFNGKAPAHLEEEAWISWKEENTPLIKGKKQVDMSKAFFKLNSITKGA